MKSILTKTSIVMAVMTSIGIAILLWAPGASASPLTYTGDLTYLFDTDKNGKISYKEAWKGAKLMEFTLPFEPVEGGVLSVSFTTERVDTVKNKLIINGVEQEFGWTWKFSNYSFDVPVGSDYAAVLPIKFEFGLISDLENRIFNGALNISNLKYSYSYNEAGPDVQPGVDPVPEPTTLILFGLGLLGAARLGRSRK